jgi:replicative DNA helicase
MIEKPQPHSVEAEQAILCSMLINPGCRHDAKKTLCAKDFYSERHQYIFPAIIEQDGTADLISIKESLTQEGLLEKAGGEQYLMSLVNVVSTSAGIQHYINIVKEASLKRQVVAISQNVIEKASSSMTSEELVTYLRKSLSAIDIRDQHEYRAGVDISNVYTPERCLQEYSDYIHTLRQNRFITGVHEIDRRIRGVGGGELLFWIARAGSFKTAMLQNLLKNYIQHSAWGAVFFSIEMPISSVTERYHEIIQGSAGKDIEEIYSTSQDGSLQIKEALESNFIKDLQNLFIIPTKVSISDVAAYVKLIEKEYKTKIGVIGIDYLGLMDGPGQGEYEIVSKLARDCKGLAKFLHLPVIVISQTSRRAGAGDVEISLDMGRGSGAIEESGDFVLGLFQVERERLSIENDQSEYDLICNILKNRKGPKGSRWKLDLDPTNLRIGPDAVPWEPPKKQNQRAYDG